MSRGHRFNPSELLVPVITQEGFMWSLQSQGFSLKMIGDLLALYELQARL